jgi:hypothetical protein
MNSTLLTIRPRFLFIALFCASVGAGLLTAEPLAPGGTFPVLKNMQDQHEVAYEMPKDVKHVAVAFTMSVGKSANQALAEKGAKFLPESKAVFIANIYGMPAVGRLFAMPKMRKYPHRIMLADADGLLDDFPQKEDLVTVFDLDDSGKIIKIHYWDPKSDEKPF